METKIIDLPQMSLFDMSDDRVYYDTIVMRVNATEKILDVLSKFFTYGRIQSFRMKKSDLYKEEEFFEQRAFNLREFLDKTLINKDEAFDVHSLDIEEYLGSSETYDVETGEVIDNSVPENYESRGVTAFYKYKPSSNYEMNVRLMYQRSQIRGMCKMCPRVEFEFSIPKFIYGHNLLLFPIDGDTNGLELDKFISKFFKELFDVDYRTLSLYIPRLDCCYNVKFEKKSNFELMRKVFCYYSQELKGKSLINNKNETFTYKTDAFSIKFYDKEAEFKKDDLKELRKYYIGQKKGVLGVQKAIEYAERIVKFYEEASRNIWRLEITLRREELNNYYWRDWRKREFKYKSVYYKKFPDYCFVRDNLKVFSSYMSKPLFEAVDGVVVPLNNNDVNFQKYLKILECRGVLVSRPVAEMFFKFRDNYRNTETLKLFRKFIRPYIIDSYQWVQKQMNLKDCVPIGCRDFYYMDLERVEKSFSWDRLMIQRTVMYQKSFIRIFKTVQSQKKVTLAHYLQANLDILNGQEIEYETKNGLKKITLTKSLINAVVRFEAKKKMRLEISRKTEYRNRKIVDALCKKYEISDSTTFYCPEKFELDFNFHKKKWLYNGTLKEFLYICPIINIMLNRIHEEFPYLR